MSLKLRSSIKPDLLNKALRQGMIFASLGCFILLFSGVFIPEQCLKIFGLPLVLISILLITFGLYPYQKLKKLETNPHEIIFLKDDHFLFSWKQKPVLNIPFSEISDCRFIDLNKSYGIALDLKNPALIHVCHKDFDKFKFMDACKVKYGCDLFFPYFTKRSFEQFMSHQEE